MSEMPPYVENTDESDVEDEFKTSTEESDWDLPLCFNQPRHLETIKSEERTECSWRLKEKYKTHCVALVLCLNISVDPPDVVKTQPCARLECWIDPLSMSQVKALETIGHALQAQYERWQPRARYKQSLDPTSEEVKKLCISLRRNAKDERVLFHYNGHGVPKPTSRGEIWVFNKAFTQYIPLSMYDLQTWMGAPSLYVYDCSNAGVIVDNFKLFAVQHEEDYKKSGGAGAGGGPPVSYHNCLQLAACAAGQALPQHPELPADLFTSCLTTPVKMAVRWFVLTQRTRVSPPDINDLLDKIPGVASDRRTMLGELNWIFTAITDTIAWNSLSPELFQQLFRADLLTASLCRNYLLADRIMRSYNCTPVCSPALPSLAGHPLWAAWDHTLDLALAQLPAAARDPRLYRHQPFFRDQLSAFRVWLDLGSPRRPPPDQLPMLLQVLLSTLHRVRALHILCRFLALGAWAVRAVLAVGIFPYMLRLLQASEDLRASMVYIWAKLIAVAPSCQVDLVNANGHKYFLSVLSDPTVDSEHRSLAAYVLAGIVDNYPEGQEAALQGGLVSVCLEQVQEAPPSVRQWLCICLGRTWRNYESAKWSGARDLAHEKLYPLLDHDDVLVRGACAFALGTFVQPGAERSELANTLEQQVGVELAARAHLDAAHIVRQEILAALQWLVLTFDQYFIAVAIQEKLRRGDREHRQSRGRVDPGLEALEDGEPLRRVVSHASLPHLAPLASLAPLAPLPTIGFGSVYMRLWATLNALARDPHPTVAAMANDILNYIAAQVEREGGESRGEGRGEGGGRASSSLPPSPNTRPDPPAPPAPTHRRGRSGLPHTITEDPALRTSTSSNSVPVQKRAIVQTELVSWAAAEFCREDDPGHDTHSYHHHQRRWRHARNHRLRNEAARLRKTHISRVDSQVFHSRCPLPPSVILFHPYDQHIAVASKDNFGLWDWGTGAKLSLGGWRRSCGRITSLAFANAHDHALLLAASHDGALAVYRPRPPPGPSPPHGQAPRAGPEPQLVAAWRALDVRPQPDRPPPAQPLYSLAQLVSEQFMSSGEERGGSAPRHDKSPQGGVPATPAPATLVSWCARTLTAAVAGHAPHIRLWDLRTERRLDDLRTESGAAVTSLWRGAGQLVAGLSDGSVRCWDMRGGAGPAAGPVLALHDHTAPVLAAVQRHDRHLLITVGADGSVLVYDRRRADVPSARLLAAAPLSAVAVHPFCNLIACGSTNQSINIYDLKGSLLNSIRFHEGFMGARIGPVSCLAFHPLRCALAVGTRDSAVSVYEPDPRR